MKYGQKQGALKRRMIAGAAIIAGLGVSPVLIPAIAAPITGNSFDGISLFDNFTPAGIDNELAEKFKASQSAASIGDFTFTPAGVNRSGKSLTVAARTLSPQTSNAVSVRDAITNVETANVDSSSILKKTKFSLKSSKGWQDFNLAVNVTDNTNAVKTPMINDLGKSSFRLDKGPKKKPSRFSPDISVARNNAAVPKTRGNAATQDYQLDVGGSFSISRKVDVTAGVRYKNQEDRLAPQRDDRRDSEAVYVGTKIKF